MGLPLLNALRWSTKADKLKRQDTMSAKNQVLLGKFYIHSSTDKANPQRLGRVLETTVERTKMDVFERGNDIMEISDSDKPRSGMIVRPAHFPNQRTLNLNAVPTANVVDSDIFTPGSLLNPHAEIVNDVDTVRDEDSVNDESFETIDLETSKKDDDELPLAFVKLQLSTKSTYQQFLMPTNSWSRRAISYDQLYYAVHARRSHDSDRSDASLTDELYIDSNYNLEFRSNRANRSNGHLRSQSMQSPELIYSSAKQGKPVHVHVNGFTAERLELA
ncbi:hypothetical protein INT43_006607 [Umbelopsis isabellina]|uniref:Uncharacterized protein n=1 Tax=Mortierella isabellina TaxID=91625 RepID=A0A8H7Q2R2_MORIS|nr:hypothetical protein INT43_006607 [Umbelopsis isabellina]